MTIIHMRSEHAIAPSDITPLPLWQRRRELIQLAAAGAAFFPPLAGVSQTVAHAAASGAQKLVSRPGPFPTIEKQTPYKDVTTYNNYYEFGLEKDDPSKNAQGLRVTPWTIAVEGEIAKPKTFDVEELLKLAPLEERIYRLRCVEGWSMVIPWVGYSLAELIKQVQPTGNAKYVEFVSLADKAQMPGLRSSVLQWPYTESLRIDEANNPLTLLALGLYGEVMPKQNGAPVRLVAPWKYGFKSGKSIVKIRFVEKQPVTSWNRAAPSEYGYFSNVNPQVDHPRWSQATERRIGDDGFLQKKRPTLMFNGYAEQVQALYTGMDLKKFF